MKTIKNWTLMSIILAALIAGVSLNGCKKGQVELSDDSSLSSKNHSDATSASERARLLSLAEKMARDTDDDAFIEATLAEFNALSAQELDKYNTIRAEYELSKLDTEFKKAGSRISSAEYEFQKHKIVQLRDMRIEVNRLSQTRHGKKSNAASFRELDPILEELMNGKYASVTVASPQSGGSKQQASVSACSVLSFPNTATKTDGNGVDDIAYYQVTKTGQTDCDWRFEYSGARTRIDPDNTNSTAMVAYYGNQTARYVYSTNTQTRIIFGNRGVWLYCGDPNGVNVEML